MAELKKLRSTLDSLPWIAQILLVLFLDPIYGAIYRLTRGDLFGLIVGVVFFLSGAFFGIGWIIDLVCVVFFKKITVLA